MNKQRIKLQIEHQVESKRFTLLFFLGIKKSQLNGWDLVIDYNHFIKKESILGSIPNWSGKRDSNSRPQPWQGCALPTELFPRSVAILAIFLSLSRFLHTDYSKIEQTKISKIKCRAQTVPILRPDYFLVSLVSIPTQSFHLDHFSGQEHTLVTHQPRYSKARIACQWSQNQFDLFEHDRAYATSID